MVRIAKKYWLKKNTDKITVLFLIKNVSAFEYCYFCEIFDELKLGFGYLSNIMLNNTYFIWIV